MSAGYQESQSSHIPNVGKRDRRHPSATSSLAALARSVGALARQIRARLAAISLFASSAHSSTLNPDLPLRRSPQAHRSHPRLPRPTLARIIVNPASGRGHAGSALRELASAADWLTAQGMSTEVSLTSAPGSARSLADEAVRQGFDVVVAAGGDGTINEVVQALAGHTTALGVLPLGTVNIWAREMNIPLSLTDACRVLVNGVRRRIDVGRANTRYFLLMAGIGIDAEVTRRVESHWLKRVGLKLLDYVAISGYLGVTQRPTRVSVRRRGTKRHSSHAVQILVGNTRLWGGAFQLARRAVADDGWLDVVYVGGHHLRHRIGVVLRAALRLPSLGQGARYERVRTLHLDAAAPLPVQVDGEWIGHLPMTFVVVPRALTVLVPRDAPADLFLHPPLED